MCTQPPSEHSELPALPVFNMCATEADSHVQINHTFVAVSVPRRAKSSLAMVAVSLICDVIGCGVTQILRDVIMTLHHK